MFRFIHCADLHLDSPLKGLSARDGAPAEELRTATRRALENLVSLCLEERVRFVVIAGDVYDGDWQDYSTGLFFNACMARLHQANIPVYLISGNHDAASVITRRLMPPPNVMVFPVDRPGTYLLEDVKVALHGQGFAQREVRENLVPRYPDPIPGYFNIGILHTSLEGHEGHEPYAPCTLDELIHKGYDYWALGHVHRRMVVHERPYVVYPGNLQGRHVREAGPKGCTVVTVEDGAVSLEHRDLDVVRWFVCSVDLTGARTDAEFATRTAVALHDLASAHPGYPLAVRVVLTGTTPLHGEVLANSEYYLSEIENAAVGVATDSIWIEQVKFATQPVADQTASGERADALALLERMAGEVAENEALLHQFAGDMAAVLARMGAYAKRDGALRIQSREDVLPVLAEAKSLLLTLLQNGGKLR